MWWIDMLLDLRHDFFARNERPAMVLVWWQSVAVLCVLWLGGERRLNEIDIIGKYVLILIPYL
jgi:hypothetical protein